MTDFSKYVGRTVKMRNGEVVTIEHYAEKAQRESQLIVRTAEGSIRVRYKNGTMFGDGEHSGDLTPPTKTVMVRMWKWDGYKEIRCVSEDAFAAVDDRTDGRWISEPTAIEIEDVGP